MPGGTVEHRLVPAETTRMPQRASVLAQLELLPPAFGPTTIFSRPRTIQ